MTVMIASSVAWTNNVVRKFFRLFVKASNYGLRTVLKTTISWQINVAKHDAFKVDLALRQWSNLRSFIQ